MEISKAKRLGYSLWVIPLAVSAFLALIELLAAPPFDPNGWYAGNNGVSCFINVLCPLGYALAWATTKSREDRLTFLTFLAIHFLLVSLTMLLSVMRLDGVPQMILEWLFLAEAFGAFVMALLRRKAVVVRAALWREPEQREARVRKRAMRAERPSFGRKRHSSRTSARRWPNRHGGGATEGARSRRFQRVRSM